MAGIVLAWELNLPSMVKSTRVQLLWDTRWGKSISVCQRGQLAGGSGHMPVFLHGCSVNAGGLLTLGTEEVGRASLDSLLLWRWTKDSSAKKTSKCQPRFLAAPLPEMSIAPKKELLNALPLCAPRGHPSAIILICVHFENRLFLVMRIPYCVLRRGRRDAYVPRMQTVRKVLVSNGIYNRRSRKNVRFVRFTPPPPFEHMFQILSEPGTGIAGLAAGVRCAKWAQFC